MGSHPLNLAVRFLLELSALVAIGVWGWKQGDGLASYLLAVGLPLVAAVLWGVFAVPDDPSRSGEAPVAIPGMLRLALELAIFTSGVVALVQADLTLAAWIMGIVTVVHYVVSYDRLLWLIKQ